MATPYITLTKVYDDANYENIYIEATDTEEPWWAYNQTMTVQVNVDMIENYQENTDVKRQDLPKGKTRWSMGFNSKVIELLQVNSAITITGSINNPENNTWATTILNGGINATATSITLTDAGSFPSIGMILIEDEFIYYTGKSTNTLTGCQRGFFNTDGAAHADTTATINRTSGAEYYFALLDFIKKHGGGVTLYWRNRNMPVYMSKFTVTDTKKESDGGTQDPTSYTVIINCFEATVR